MDPFSVSTACVGLLAAVAQLSVQITKFVSGVREARRDMDSVSRELSSLALCLETLRDDSTKIQYPDGLKQTLVAVLRNCDGVTKEMLAQLEKMSSRSLGRRAQWVATGRDEINRLRSSLEAYKSALDIALEMTAISIISAVKDDVNDVKATTAAIKEDTTQIPDIKQDTSSLIQEIAFLRLQVTELQQHDTGSGMILQRFLQESTTYAETVIDTLEGQEELNHPDSPLQAHDENAQRELRERESPLSNALAGEASAQVDRFKEARSVEDSPGGAEITEYVLVLRENKTPGLLREVHESLSRVEISMRDFDSRERIIGNRTEGSVDQYHTGGVKDGETGNARNSLGSKFPANQVLEDVDIAEVLRDKPTPAKRRHANFAAVIESGNAHTAAAVSEPERAQLIRKSPDSEAMRAAAAARGLLSAKEKQILDTRLRILINRRSGFNHRLMVEGAAEIRKALDAGAHFCKQENWAEEALRREVHQLGRPDVTELLLSRGALTDSATEILITATRHFCALPLIQHLLEYGANPNGSPPSFFGGGATLYCAAQNAATKQVSLLLKYGADPNWECSDPKFYPFGSPLHVACHQGWRSVVTVLLENGAHVSIAAGSPPLTPMQITQQALERGVPGERIPFYTGILRILRQYGAMN